MDHKQAKLEQWEKRKQTYTNTWEVGLIKTPCKDPLCCCTALWCPWCTSYVLRKRAMHDSLEGYTCCNGALPCSGRMGEKSCPELCLCCEVCCCFGFSVAATRWMIQDELHLQNTTCDNCIIGTMIFLQQLACVCNIIACLTDSEEIETLADAIELIAELVWWTVCACMQTQHNVQLEKRDKSGGGPQPPPRADQSPAITMPPASQAPPGYPPAAPTGYPAGPGAGAYPPQPGYASQGGYPQPGYPPAGTYPPPQANYPPQQQYYPPAQGMQR